MCEQNEDPVNASRSWQHGCLNVTDAESARNSRSLRIFDPLKAARNAGLPLAGI
jgi:hypothetical protein